MGPAETARLGGKKNGITLKQVTPQADQRYGISEGGR